jgi:glycosyltransferase involved in cell wall biosynthesis
MNKNSGTISTCEKEVSIIVAIRNEEKHIRKCLNSLISQTFPHDQYEIVVIDGISDDQTREIIHEFGTNYPDIIRIFDNPSRIASAGRNIGITNSKGKRICIFGGHSYADPKFLRKLVDKLDSSPESTGGVGSMHLVPVDETLSGKIIARVQMSFLGGMGTSFMNNKKDEFVKSLAFCLYRRDIFVKVGLHDETFILGEDFELNWRIHKAGFRLLCHSEPLVYYYRKNDSLKLFSKQMIQYGIWRMLVTKKHPDSFPIVFIMPITLLLSIASLPIMVFLSSLLTQLIFYGLSLYITIVVINSISHCIREKNFNNVISILFYLSEHLFFGIGLIAGALRKIKFTNKINHLN